MGLTGFREGFKKPGRRWNEEVTDLNDDDLQRLEARLRRSKRTSGAGLGTSAVLAAGASALAPTAALGILASARQRSCASKKLKIVRQMLAERQVPPLGDDFVRDRIVPVVSGAVFPACAAGFDAGMSSMAESWAGPGSGAAMPGTLAYGFPPPAPSFPVYPPGVDAGMAYANPGAYISPQPYPPPQAYYTSAQAYTPQASVLASSGGAPYGAISSGVAMGASRGLEKVADDTKFEEDDDSDYDSHDRYDDDDGDSDHDSYEQDHYYRDHDDSDHDDYDSQSDKHDDYDSDY